MTPPQLTTPVDVDRPTGRTQTPPPQPHPARARQAVPQSDENEKENDPSRLMPLRQSNEFIKSNKWRARAIANPFAKRKPAVANNDKPSTPPEPAQSAAPVVIRKSTFKMQPTNQEETEPPPPAANSVVDAYQPQFSKHSPPRPVERPLQNTKVQQSPPRPVGRPQQYNKVQRSPPRPAARPPSPTPPESPEREPAQPPSPKWDPEVAPKPKAKPQPKRPKGKASSCVGALAEIQRKREERRAQQAQEKQRKEDELKEHGDDTGYKFRRLIKAFRDNLAKPSKRESAAVAPSSTSKLSVFVRKRPLSKKELSHKGYDVITCAKATQLYCHEPKLKVDMSESLENHLFAFDGVFDEQTDNQAVYAQSVGPLVPQLLSDGILTVFAYGQTGSGKTYTMKSVYRQAAMDLFVQLKAHPKPVQVGVSFYDIYKNNVCDLLNGRKKVQALEDNEGVVQLVGVSEVVITNGDMLTELVEKGEASRITSINGVHDDSSRSHAILRVTLYTGASVAGNQISGGTACGRLSMVDLAGSERACETQTDDKSTRMEGAEINKSLLALKECIRAMDVGAKHLPFRQSKLTQILRDSFMCETSRTVMIATVSPCSEHSNHTLNTLRYADRLKEINSRGDNDV